MDKETENFASLLEEYMGQSQILSGKVVKGTVVALEEDAAIIDVGLKSEGRVPLREFGINPQVNVGDKIDVYVDKYEDKNGQVVLSREKAKKEEAWNDLEVLLAKGEPVVGTMFAKVKGGFTVDLNGAIAFLPGSQIDVRPIRDVTPLMNVPQPFQILKMDKVRGNIVVSRRAILEESRSEQRNELMKDMSEGQIVEGTVKNVTDYGAFIDLGGLDGLLHVTDISWKRINHPSEVLTVGQKIKAQIIKFSSDTGRISLGMKQLEEDPWNNVAENFKVGEQMQGKVTNITDYGVFVDLKDGVEGLVHVSEMSWTKKNTHPSKIVTMGEVVDVVVLEIDSDKRRISLGMKQTKENPWKAFVDSHQIGDTLKGEIKNITEFGMFLGLNEDIDGMIHMSDISWDIPGEEAIKAYTKGQEIEVKILDMDADKERVSLGIKQLTKDNFEEVADTIKKGQIVTGVVSEIDDTGITVDVDGIKGFIKRTDLSREKTEQKSDRFAIGEKVDAKVMTLDTKNRKMTLSIKAKEIAEEKEALAEYGSADSGASLGDILGAALQKAKKK